MFNEAPFCLQSCDLGCYIGQGLFGSLIFRILLEASVPGLAYYLALLFSVSEAVHLLIMQPLLKEKSDRANFVIINNLAGFLPLFGIAAFHGLPPMTASFCLFVMTASILQAIGLNTLTTAARLGKLTWLLALDSVSPVIQAGIAFFFQHQQLRVAEGFGIVMITGGLAMRFRPPKKNDAPLNDAPPDIRGWHRRLWRFLKGSLVVLYLAAKLVWVPYTPVVQQACYSAHKGWATPAFVMSFVFLIGAILSFGWNVMMQKKHSKGQAEQLSWGALTYSMGASSWRYFFQHRRVFALDAVILTFQQFAELTALIHANVAAVSAVTKTTLVFLLLIRLVNWLRKKDSHRLRTRMGIRARMRMIKATLLREWREWVAVGLLIAGAIVMPF